MKKIMFNNKYGLTQAVEKGLAQSEGKEDMELVIVYS